ncbi:MAG: tRNA (adenosine(37)-N6)-threonylcarbamoyltransferase complex dimerization subunit type 1 TsaB, partial [Pyrinomonadaceae bacterium]
MILAIEAAIGGGSLCLFDGEIEVANWIGDRNGLRAEQLITQIEVILASAEINKRDIKTVVVSAGPGSFTGIRIGIATGLGLKNALNVPLFSILALEAMARSHNHTGMVAVPMGRGTAAAQRFFEGTANAPPFSVSTDELFNLDPGSALLVHDKLAAAPADRS